MLINCNEYKLKINLAIEFFKLRTFFTILTLVISTTKQTQKNFQDSSRDVYAALS